MQDGGPTRFQKAGRAETVTPDGVTVSPREAPLQPASMDRVKTPAGRKSGRCPTGPPSGLHLGARLRCCDPRGAMSCGSPMPRGEQIAKPAEWGHPRGRLFFFPKAVRAPVPVPNIPRTRKRSCPMRRLTLLFCLAALAAPALDAQEAPAPATTSARRRVAVLDFDYGTVHSYVTDIWGSDVDIGKGIANMLLTELVQNGTYTLIERTQVDRILNEQNLQQEGRADASTAATLGRLLGVDAIIIGSITQFVRDDKKLNVGGGKIGFHGIGLGGLGKKSSKATVAIDARIVNIGTGEILAVAQGKGESKRSGLTLAGAGGGGGGVLGGVLAMSSSDFGSTILGEAPRAAVTDLVTALAAAAPKIPETIAASTALVADVTGSELNING